jgi:hypothetical protein
MVNGSVSPAASTATGPFGWLVALAALAAISGVAWLLLHSQPSDEGPGARPVSVRCAECGEQIRGDWRLCPYCGARVS